MTQSIPMNNILLFVFNNDKILKRIQRLVIQDLREDMRTHLILQLTKIPPEKLNSLYKDNKLINYTMRILYHQMSPRCLNCFHQMYYPSIFKEVVVTTTEKPIIQPDDDIQQQQIPGVYNKVLKDVLNYVQMMSPHKYQIFYMSYIEGYTNKEIAEKSKCTLMTIINYKNKILKDIKIKLQQDGYTTNIHNN